MVERPRGPSASEVRVSGSCDVAIELYLLGRSLNKAYLK